MNTETGKPHQAGSSRREFLRRSGLALAGVAITTRQAAADKPAPKAFHLWASGDSHVGTDLKHGRESLADAILHAGQDRLRPVVLTAMTAVLGLVPLTLGGVRMWSSFGWVNIFGLVASIPLSLVLLPALIALSFRLTGRSA